MKWLRELRKQNGIKGIEIVKSLGVTKLRYYHIESGYRKATIGQAKKIANILDFDWTEFYDDIQ